MSFSFVLLPYMIELSKGSHFMTSLWVLGRDLEDTVKFSKLQKTCSQSLVGKHSLWEVTSAENAIGN